MVDPLVVATLVILGSVGALSGWFIYRFPLPFKIARRNIARARGRSILIVLGLLVGTAIISGSLVVGDTTRSINTYYNYLAAGFTDEGIYGHAATGGYLYFPQSVASAIVNASQGDPTIAGVTPEIVDRAQLFDQTTGIPQTNLNLVAADPATSGALGHFTSSSGAALNGPAPGQVFLDRRAAEDLNAHIGDTVTLYGVQPVLASVQAIVEDDIRGGVLTAGLSGGNVFCDLPLAQAIENVSGQVNFIAITNTGSQVDGMALTSTVSAHLNATLAATAGTERLAVHSILQPSIAAAEVASSGTVTNFLVFGLFSIVAGAMLIVGIFTMIAEERKGEMGMLRAIGLTRRDIVLTYYFEGLLYSAGSALAGTFVGVAAGYGLMAVYTLFVPSSVVSGSVILSSFTYSTSSLIVSYLVGFLLTLATVAVASLRISRLNIVRAIRDVPEPPPATRTYTELAYLGVVTFAAGLLLFGATFRGTGDVIWPVIAGGLLLLGLGLIASRFVRNRLAFSFVGAGLLVWVGVEPLRNLVLGSGHSFGMIVVFVMGTMMVLGALLLVAFNGPDLARLLERVGSGRAGTTPVMRLGLAYPSRRAARTSITLAIFALVLFTIVMLATFTATVTGSLNDSVAAQSGGYTFFGSSAQPIPDLPGAVAANGTLAPLFSTIVPLTVGTGQVDIPGYAQNPYTDRVFAAPSGAGAASDFYATNHFPFTSTLDGMGAGAAMEELETNQSVAIVDANYAGAGGLLSVFAHPTVGVGQLIRVEDPATGDFQNLTVIGVLKTSILPGIWINPSTAAAMGYGVPSAYLLTVADGQSSTLAAQKLKAAFYTSGLALYSFSDALASSTALISGQIGLLEVFIALGLTIGIAALGILALRAVTERRHEIGVLRATGMTRGMVLRMFLLEYAFVTLLGSLIGGVLGVLLIYNLVTGAGAASAGVTALYIPWSTILAVLATTGVLATLAVIGPSLKAARLPPAQAIRATD